MRKTTRIETVEERERERDASTCCPAPVRAALPRVRQPAPDLALLPHSIAVVGNGPSACGLGQKIDACDMVIRCNDWRGAFQKNEAGTKVDVVACWPALLQEMRGRPEAPGVQLWVSTFDAPVGPQWAGVPIRMPSEEMYFSLHDRLLKMHVKREDATNCWPSTGLIAIATAMTFRPKRLLIAGFDATSYGKKGWGEPSDKRPWGTSTAHDFVAEKRLIAELIAEFPGQVEWEQLP